MAVENSQENRQVRLRIGVVHGSLVGQNVLNSSRMQAMNTEASEAIHCLKQACARYRIGEVAKLLGRTPRTVTRWRTGQIPPPSDLLPRLQQLLTDGQHGGGADEFRFINLFAGVGGIRFGFHRHGGRCVFTSEWNSWSQQTYAANFGEAHPIVGDIVPYDAHAIPDHDVLLAGFPCQPFSIAGVSKKNALGRPHGFGCRIQGTLSFDVARILSTRQPKAFLVENVKNLLSHDKGNTFRVILQTLHEELGYEVHYGVIDGQHFVPQHRERIIVGFRKRPDLLGTICASLHRPASGNDSPSRRWQ